MSEVRCALERIIILIHLPFCSMPLFIFLFMKLLTLFFHGLSTLSYESLELWLLDLNLLVVYAHVIFESDYFY